MKKLRSPLSAAAGIAGLAAVSGAAHAQGFDYGAMEDLFNEPVTTSATGAPQRASEAPASMVIITGEDLRRSGVTTIPDALQNYAGIDVNRYSAMQRDVTIRGANIPYSPRLLVLVNGRQVYLDHLGYTDWQLIGVELDDIQQVEVVRGPNSALFGFNAVAGVVNIITKDALGPSGVSGHVETGEDAHTLATISGQMRLSERVGLRLTAGYEEADEWDSVEAAWQAYGRDNDRAERVTFGAEMAVRLGDKTTANFSYNYAEADKLAQAYAYNLVRDDASLHGVNAELASETSFGLFQAQAYYNRFEEDGEVTALGDFQTLDELFVLKVEDLFKVGADHTFRISGEYRHGWYSYSNKSNGVLSYDVYAGGAMWAWQTLDWLTLTNAVRVDRVELSHDDDLAPFNLLTQDDYDQAHTPVSFNSSAVARLDGQTTLRASIARGVQVPSLNSLGVSLDFGAVMLSGDPTQKPSITDSYELALTRQVPAIDGALELTIARQEAEGVLISSNSQTASIIPSGILLTEAPIGDFDTTSFEAALRGGAGGALGWEVNYTWTDVKEGLLTPQTNADLTLAEGTPEHKVNVILDYRNDGWESYVVGRYRSDTTQRVSTIFGVEPAAFVERDADFTVDARFGYRFENGASVWVAGENLTDNEAAGLPAYDAERRFRIGLGYKY